MVLTAVGHQVSSAFDGPTGLSLVLKNPPDIVLCDIGLPGIDGYEVAAQVRAQNVSPKPTMIALTGYGQSEDRVRALAQGFDHYLVKPVDPLALLKLITTVGAARG
jgi:CheY-like chemotaxis protein